MKTVKILQHCLVSIFSILLFKHSRAYKIYSLIYSLTLRCSKNHRTEYQVYYVRVDYSLGVKIWTLLKQCVSVERGGFTTSHVTSRGIL